MEKNNQKGSTMVETLLYISLLIMLAMIAYSTIAKGINRYKIGRLSQQLVDLKRAIIQYTAVDEDYSNLTEEGMKRATAMPIDMRAFRHSLSGSVFFGPATEIAINPADPINKYMYYITFENVGKEACLEVLTSGQFYTDGSEMDSLIVNTTYGWKYPFSHFDLTTSVTKIMRNHNITLQDVMPACNKERTNKITWIFS